MGPKYLSGGMTEEELSWSEKGFAARRCIHRVAMAVDGSHVPYWPPDRVFKNEYRNYKGFYSLNVLAFVNSFYMFVSTDIGMPGRVPDSVIFHRSALGQAIKRDPTSVLGLGRIIFGDGGFNCCPGMMAPWWNAKTKEKKFFNFCFSSTRFFVEQAFGLWKERWRILKNYQIGSQNNVCARIYTTMILHNVLQLHMYRDYDDNGMQEALDDVEQEYRVLESLDEAVAARVEHCEERYRAMFVHLPVNDGAGLCKKCAKKGLRECDHGRWDPACDEPKDVASEQLRGHLTQELWADFARKHPEAAANDFNDQDHPDFGAWLNE